MSSLVIRFIGLVCLVSLIAVAFLAGLSVVLHCNHTGPGRIRCVKDMEFLGLVRVHRGVIEDIRQARVDEYCATEGCDYRVVFITGNGPIPLTTYYSAFLKRGIIGEINSFVKDGGTGTLRIRTTSLWINWLSFLVLTSLLLFLWPTLRKLL